MKIKRVSILKVIFSLCIVFFIGIISLYFIDKSIGSRAVYVANAEVRIRVNEIINENILKEYSKGFDYNDIINIDKDNQGDIVMLRADTIKLNYLSINVAMKCQSEIKHLADIGIKIPLGYVFNNNVLSNVGPDINIRIRTIGDTKVSYSSIFESAGINQTRHKIYVQVVSNIRVVIPFNSSDIEVICEMPVSETIIVGKVPRTSVDLDLIH
ncbi:sporulation protein YunB [Clostridium putrefaciens]|uniref:Sporulation protein YunB n=1 Tax=Clostridium putrefaciens TaxID=99675 RepID=A0A381J811_9CLOT|nr:sporulation protein YunB [Clostridium putrefaciens]SUY47414.1 sporulation protein YunB [Clostridium putrefaciens]